MSNGKRETPSQGKGATIQIVCMAMMVLSLAGGIVGAAQFSKVPVATYASYTRMEHSPELVVYWLVGAVASAALWYALSGVGTLIDWFEFNRQGEGQPSAIESMPPNDDSVLASTTTAEDQPIVVAPSDEAVAKTEEQMEAQRRSASNARFLMAAIFIVIGVAFYFAVFAK